jgi:hypothetical protein
MLDELKNEPPASLMIPRQLLLGDVVILGACRFTPPVFAGDPLLLKKDFEAISEVAGRLRNAFHQTESGRIEFRTRFNRLFTDFINRAIKSGALKKPKPRYKHAGKYQIRMRKG